eukprot:CAMPEP_0197537984 /NCGR_PEP_ID=MMETSP1318-20131121/58462_1 /TAXON_ID=552666 /ORGANISM="Partenskyella glossopodia, Strain RCC365" /LENGTH=49 /DNA_ID=CAMNT_0043096279 /DNA_START=225 /DNA_END=374 /DNA_ORIENTATION=-
MTNSALFLCVDIVWQESRSSESAGAAREETEIRDGMQDREPEVASEKQD